MKTKRSRIRKTAVIQLDADRILLRGLRKADAPVICRHLQERLISRYTFIRYPYTLSDAEQFVRSSRKHLRMKTQYHLGIELKSTREIIGVVGLFKINVQHRNAEIGCWLAKPFRRQGLMAEALRAMLGFAFGSLKLIRVHAHVFPENVASRKMVLGCGFTFEGCLRKSAIHHGRRKDNLLFSILKEEFQQLRSRGSTCNGNW